MTKLIELMTEEVKVLAREHVINTDKLHVNKHELEKISNEIKTLTPIVEKFAPDYEAKKELFLEKLANFREFYQEESFVKSNMLKACKSYDFTYGTDEQECFLEAISEDVNDDQKIHNATEMLKKYHGLHPGLSRMKQLWCLDVDENNSWITKYEKESQQLTSLMLDHSAIEAEVVVRELFKTTLPKIGDEIEKAIGAIDSYDFSRLLEIREALSDTKQLDKAELVIEPYIDRTFLSTQIMSGLKQHIQGLKSIEDCKKCHETYQSQMIGSVESTSFEQAISKRMEIIKPNIDDVETSGKGATFTREPNPDRGVTTPLKKNLEKEEYQNCQACTIL